MKQMKKWILLNIGMILMLSMAGCGKKQDECFEQQPSQSTAPAARAPKVVGEQQYTQRTYTPTQDAMDAMMQEWEESHA